nr:MAG TPA: hypothetical protein [Caudoviricetes sp.]
MKYDKERFEWLPYEKKMGLIEKELSLGAHNATTRADLLMLLDWAYKKIKTDKKRIEDGIAHCYMTKFEYPGMEEGLCAGLRTMDGDGEPYETCKECRLQYQYNDMHQEAEE